MSDVYVLGGAQTDFERNWKKEGKNMLGLLSEVTSDCFSNTGIEYDEIAQLNKSNKVAFFVGNFIAEKYCDQGHLGALMTMVAPEFSGVPSARYEAACASSSVALDAAISKIRCGDYDLAIVVGWELMKTVDAKTGGGYLGHAALYEQEAKGVDFPFPTLFSQLADVINERNSINESRFMDCLSSISSINYQNAKNNPLAQTRNWFMSDKQTLCRGMNTNPIISGKLAGTDCSQVTDGAVMVVLASKKYLENKGKSPAVFPTVAGFGHRVAPMLFEAKIKESKDSQYVLPWTRQAVVDAYDRAGITADDVDVFETHDCFTSSEYAAISAFGITKPGEEYKAIEDGTITLDGKKPINPSGGLIGCGHPVGASGVRMFLDLYKQVTGRAGDYQVSGAKIGTMLNIGGSATTNYVYILKGAK